MLARGEAREEGHVCRERHVRRRDGFRVNRRRLGESLEMRHRVARIAVEREVVRANGVENHEEDVRTAGARRGRVRGLPRCRGIDERTRGEGRERGDGARRGEGPRARATRAAPRAAAATMQTVAANPRARKRPARIGRKIGQDPSGRAQEEGDRPRPRDDANALPEFGGSLRRGARPPGGARSAIPRRSVPPARCGSRQTP